MLSALRRRAMVLAMAWPPALTARAAPVAPPALPQRISLDSDCSACPTRTRIVLQADGLIQWQRLGKARWGTADETRQSRVSLEEFATVARLWQLGGLARLPAEPPDDGTRDGPWQLLRLERADGSAQQILRRGEPDPQAVVDVIEALRRTARKVWPDAP